MRALAEHTAESAQRRRLQELCSKQGTADYNFYVREPSLSILELLTAFPSCLPPLSVFIGTHFNATQISYSFSPSHYIILQTHFYSVSSLHHNINEHLMPDIHLAASEKTDSYFCIVQMFVTNIL